MRINPHKRRRAPNMDIDVKFAIDALALVTDNASAIARQLQRTEAIADRAPGERAVQNYLEAGDLIAPGRGAWRRLSRRLSSMYRRPSKFWGGSSRRRTDGRPVSRSAKRSGSRSSGVPFPMCRQNGLSCWHERTFPWSSADAGRDNCLPQLARLDRWLAVRPWESAEHEVLRVGFMGEVAGLKWSRVPDEVLRGGNVSKTRRTRRSASQRPARSRQRSERAPSPRNAIHEVQASSDTDREDDGSRSDRS